MFQVKASAVASAAVGEGRPSAGSVARTAPKTRSTWAWFSSDGRGRGRPQPGQFSGVRGLVATSTVLWHCGQCNSIGRHSRRRLPGQLTGPVLDLRGGAYLQKATTATLFPGRPGIWVGERAARHGGHVAAGKRDSFSGRLRPGSALGSTGPGRAGSVSVQVAVQIGHTP